MKTYTIYAQRVIERTYEIKAKSGAEAKALWEKDRTIAPVNEETLKGEEITSIVEDGIEIEV
jgi:hypothetical protein